MALILKGCDDDDESSSSEDDGGDHGIFLPASTVSKKSGSTTICSFCICVQDCFLSVPQIFGVANEPSSLVETDSQLFGFLNWDKHDKVVDESAKDTVILMREGKTHFPFGEKRRSRCAPKRVLSIKKTMYWTSKFAFPDLEVGR